MQQHNQNKVSIFIYHSGIYIYAFILIIAGIIINEVSSETSLHKSIKISEEYNDNNGYKENSLVHLTDIISSQGIVSDNEFIFKQKNIIVLKKTVEMYQWKLRLGKHSSYQKDWESRYINHNDKLHRNPIKIRNLGIFYYYPKSVHIGTVPLPMQNFKSSSYIQFQLEESIKDNRNHHYIFLGGGTINSPDIGDIRIRYQGYKSNQTTTVFATFSKNGLLFKNDKNYTSFYGTNLFQTLYKGNIDNVIDVYIDNENSYKQIFNLLLSLGLFMTFLKFTIIIFNMANPKGIKSNIKKYPTLFLVILISIIGTYLLNKIILLGTSYF